MLGDEVFYKGLRDVIVDKGFKIAAWDDFRDSFGKASGKDLRWFFRQVEEGLS
jgi:aminopeptidase N